MSSRRLPRVTAREMARVLERLGFVVVRQSGSHRVYRNLEGRRVVLPFHATKVLHPKIVRNILQDAGLSPEEFVGLF